METGVFDDCPSYEKCGYFAFYFWTDRNNAPAVLSEVDGYPKYFETKEEAIAWVDSQVDTNCNITWCVTKSDEWKIEKLKSLYKK